jgi:ATP-binding cassette, subfamily C, bacterial
MTSDPQRAATTTSAGATAVPSTVGSVWRLLRSVLDQAPGRAALVLGLTFALILTSGVSLVMLVPLLGVAGLDVGEGSIGQLAEWVASVLGAVGLSPTVGTVIAAYLAIVIGSAALSRAHAVEAALLHQDYVMTLRLRVYEAITRSRWASYVRRPSSDFMHALTQEIERVAAAVTGLLQLVVKVVMTGIYLGLALYVSLATTLLVTALGGALMALLARKTRLGRAKGEAVSSAYRALYAAISEHLGGLRITKSHGSEGLHLERFGERARRTAGAQVDMARNQADVGFWLHTGSAAIMAGVFGAALLVLELPLAGILLLLFLFARLVPMLTGVQRQFQTVLTMLPAVDRVEETLAWLDEHAEGGAREAAESEADAPSLERALRFERVSFGYEGAAGEAVLQDVALEIPAGRTTAIVGPSGGGKSTVADLAVGLLTPDAGRVLVDDVALEGARINAWRRRIGYVNQDTFLFNDTIRQNLLFVRPEASEGELREALEAASASFVESLPEGLESVVGDRGVRLSGGERQRIALARAILRRPVLLVLDEATSALDPENERVIQAAIERMAGRQTILIIAHRLSSVRSADVIYVVEHGRVVESGGWDELLRLPRGRFRALCQAQGLLEDAGARPAAAGP